MPSDPEYTVLLRAVVRRLNSFALIHLGANSVRGRDIEKYDLPPILCRPKRANFNYSNLEKVLLLLFCVFSCSNAKFFCFLWDFP